MRLAWRPVTDLCQYSCTAGSRATALQCQVSVLTVWYVVLSCTSDLNSQCLQPLEIVKINYEACNNVMNVMNEM